MVNAQGFFRQLIQKHEQKTGKPSPLRKASQVRTIVKSVPPTPKSGGSGGGGQAPRRALPLPVGIDPESKLGKVLVEPSPVVHEGKIVPGTMTAQQYFQKTSEAKTDIGRQKGEYFAIQESIKPTSMYRYEGVVIPGFLVKRRIEKEYLPQLEKAEVQSQSAWSQARDLPKDTIVTKTDEGYKFKFRDTSLDWSKGEFKKIEKAPLGVRQVAEFGFGAVSSFGALVKPVVLDPLIGTERSRASHFVSPLDVAFEPIGWSPKGSTELMRKHPIFTAGGVGAEVVQAYAMSGLFSGGKLTTKGGVKVVAKFPGLTGYTARGIKKVITKVPSAYLKFTKVFPEEKLVSGAARKIGTTEVGRTTYRWGAKGYKLGRELTSAGVKTSKKATEKMGSKLQKVGQKTTYGRGGVKRVWLSPEKYAKAEQDIASKLASKKLIEKSVQARIKGGVGEASKLIERTQYKLSWSGKRLLKKYGYVRETWKVGKDVSPLYKTHKVGMKGSIERFALEGAGEPITSSGWYAKIKDMYTYGYSRVVPTETGHVVSMTKGFGTPGIRPVAKRWITLYRPPFLKNIQAQTSIAIQSLKSKMAKSSSKMYGRAGILHDLYTKTVPDLMGVSILEPSLGVATLGVSKGVSASRIDLLKPTIPTVQDLRFNLEHLKPKVDTVQKQRHDVSLVPMDIQDKMTAQMFDVGFVPAMKTGQMLEQMKITEPMKVTEPMFPVFHMDNIFKAPKPDRVIPRTIPDFFVLPIDKGLYGRGRMYGGMEFFGKAKKFRKGELDMIFGIEV